MRTLGLSSQLWRVLPATAGAAAEPLHASPSLRTGKIRLVCFAKTILALLDKKSYRNERW